MQAKIRGLNCDRGFCFLRPSDGGSDIFLHVKNLTGVDNLTEDLRDREVTFDVEETEKGRRAVNARLIGW